MFYGRVFTRETSQFVTSTFCMFICCVSYKVVQIWPGRFVCKQVTVCPGHIWTTLYFWFVYIFCTLECNMYISVFKEIDVFPYKRPVYIHSVHFEGVCVVSFCRLGLVTVCSVTEFIFGYVWVEKLLALAIDHYFCFHSGGIGSECIYMLLRCVL